MTQQVVIDEIRRLRDALAAAEAERDRLREALREIAEHRTGQRTLTMHAFAALGEEVPSWSS